MQARAPSDVARRIFLIATEESGDRLGANLMKVLRQRLGDAVRFEGVGGRAMAREGLTSLFPIEELSIVGLSAVVRQLPKILRLIRQTTDAVTEAVPDVLVIIDSPDSPTGSLAASAPRPIDPDRRLCFAVGLGVAPGPGACDAPLCRSRAGAAAVRAGGLSAAARAACSYVGHPLVEQIATLRPDNSEQARRDGTPPVLLVLPGSRRSEIRHHMAVFGATLGRLRAQGAAFDLILPTMPHLHEAVTGAASNWPVQPRIVVGEADKKAAFRIAHAALVKSGTVTLELALAAVPMVAAYRVGSAEAWVLRRAISTSSVILANLVIGENVVPEFVQENCTAEKLAQPLAEILTDSPPRRRQSEAFARLDAIMSTGDQSPSVRAADIVLATMRKSRRAS